MAYDTNKNKKRSNLKNKINKLCNPENSALSSMVNCTHLEINGNNEVIVEGCKSIVEYDENIIKISTKKMFIQFLGRNLRIKCLNTDSLVIQGFITSIEFMT